MERGWTRDGSARFDAAEPDRAVFQRVFGYLAAPGVKVPRFTEDWEMATAIPLHVEEAWRPLSTRMGRRQARATPSLASPRDPRPRGGLWRDGKHSRVLGAGH